MKPLLELFDLRIATDKQRREIRRLRRALREIVEMAQQPMTPAHPLLGDCKCAAGIATRGLKGKK